MNLLVTGAFACTEKELNMLRELGHNIVFMQQEKSPLPCQTEWVEGIIGNGIFLSHPIENFTNLKFIQLTSAGFDRVDMDYVKEHGIEIHNARGVYSIPMAEFAICGVLQLYKQSRFFNKNQSENKWEKHRELLELYGKTVLIVGCGSVGTECAKRFSAFGCNVLGVDLYPREDKNYNKMVTLDLLDNAISDADIVVLTLPLTDETYHLFNDKRLKRLRKNAVLVNISRGAVIDTVALIESLPKIGGAVLDVFEEEPLPLNSPLWNMNNVIITPHNSFVGDGNRNRLNNMIISNLNRG
ncbi:MAG: NAD(P)-dependent oxidoreductase [Acutalibacteraceae bacterium]|nr:NAD(P)-dependent oxidoreductase [Acutalibacteraceae bacterium]